MEGGALFNPGFIGGNFIWWLGQIADNSSWRNNEEPGRFENAASIPGFGKRYKVRIIGVHDKEEEQIKSDQLPWATIMYPVTSGGGQGGSFQTANLRQGMFVFGFWMDGQDMQVPIIMGVLGNNALTELQTKIGNSETNFGPTSGFAQGKEDITGTAKSLPKDDDKTIVKAQSAEELKESAIVSPSTKPGEKQKKLDQFGLPVGEQRTRQQIRDIESAKASIESMGKEELVRLFGTDTPSVSEINKEIKKKVTEGIKKRVAFANSPGSPARPGATLEGIETLMQVAASDVKLADKYLEKTVLIVPDKVVESSVKAMQTITDNLTTKVEKYMSSLGSYADAVSGPPQEADLQKLVKDAACNMSKYMKVIMDKMMEYSNKTLNEELTETVSSMPSCMRYQMADMKNVMNEKSLEQYNKITDKVCGSIEGILNQALNLGDPANGYEGGIIEQRKKEVDEFTGITTTVNVLNRATGELVGITTTIDELQTHPIVPMCSAEDIVGTAIALVKDDINKANDNSIQGVSKYVGEMTAQLERLDSDLKERAPDESTAGAILTITDEEVMDEVRGGTLYKTMTKVGIVWKTSTVSTRQVLAGFGTDKATGQGALVDIVVPRGGLGKDGNGQSIDFTWISNGTGYPNPSGNQLNVSGGTGTGMKVNVQTNASGVITNMFTHTVGTGYKLLDDNQEPYIYTIQSGNFDAKFKLDAVWGPIENGGIKVNKRGVGYVEGDVYAVLNGSGDATFMIVAVDDPGDGKADSDSSKPQQLGSMIPKIPNMGGNLTSALNFKNITANIFPFELPPNASPVDFVTLANGGEGQPDRQTPSMDNIRQVVADSIKKIDVSSAEPFLTPSQKGAIDLAKKEIRKIVDE